MAPNPSSGASSQAHVSLRDRISFSSWMSSLRELAESFVHLLVLEAKQAGISLAFMVGFAVAAAVLLITGWLAAIACIVAALVLNGILGWISALVIAAVLSFAGAGVLAYLVVARAKDLLFSATRRQLSASAPAMESPNGTPR